jgi:hypothetical protein
MPAGVPRKLNVLRGVNFLTWSASFVKVRRYGRYRYGEPAIDIRESLAYTVPGLVAHQSALQGGTQMKIPQL